MRLLLLACGIAVLPGCGSLLETTLPAPQAYVLRLAPATVALQAANPGSLLVQRPEAGPGLASEHIALLRSGQRFDFYAASRWAAPSPDLVESVLVDQLRASGLFAAVFDDSSPYAPTYNLRCGLNRFEADYTQGGSAPTVQVTLDCTLGRHRDRVLLVNFIAQGSVKADDDRVSAVIAAFETATAAAVASTSSTRNGFNGNGTPRSRHPAHNADGNGHGPGRDGSCHQRRPRSGELLRPPAPAAQVCLHLPRLVWQPPSRDVHDGEAVLGVADRAQTCWKQ